MDQDSSNGSVTDKRNWRERLGIGTRDIPKLAEEFKTERTQPTFAGAAERAPRPAVPERSAHADAERAIHKAASPEALRATIASLYKEAENFRKANEEQLAKLRGSLVPGKKPAADVSGMSDADLLKALGQ